jgi:hypothetical protein
VLTWGVERLREPAPAPASELAVSSTAAGPTASGVSQTVEAPAVQQLKQPAEGFEPARVEIETLPPTREVPAARRWLWWGPTALALALALLFGVAAAVHREQQVVRDSPDFAKALQCVKPLLRAINATPRAVKRYQNRMRYLAARLRPQAHEPDRIDSLLHWLGGRLGRELVPRAWFDERPRSEITEPALILLGAIELFAPHAFGEPPTAVLSSLEVVLKGERLDAWRATRGAFADAHLPMPTPEEVARYATFVQAVRRPGASRPNPLRPVPPSARLAAGGGA